MEEKFDYAKTITEDYLPFNDFRKEEIQAIQNLKFGEFFDLNENIRIVRSILK